MRFASSIASGPDFETVLEQLFEPIDARVTPGMVDLVLLFCTGDFTDDLERVMDRLYDRFPTAVLLGCTGEGTIGYDREVERKPSMSLLAASLPEVQIRPFHLTQSMLEHASTVADWERLVAVAPESKPCFVTLADPFRIDLHSLVERMNEVYPNAPLVGGIASAARAPGENRLLIGDQIHREGIVGVAMTGNCEVDTVVSQGCRPIGSPFVITKGDGNIVHELGGLPPLQQLQKVIAGLSENEKRLARQSLLLGRVIDEYKDRFCRGDFLIHNIVGVDKKSGALGVAGHARTGTTVQFHVRDASSADEDLRALLNPYADADVRGAMLFGCNGRGTRMWTEPNHDVSVLREILGDVPVAGFFCAGEFGPVGGKNFIHGFTASVVLFRPKTTDASASL